MDLLTLLDQLDDHFAKAPRVPLSGQIRVDHDTVFGLLDQIREAMPAEIAEARTLLARRDRVLADAQRQAEGVIAEARTAAAGGVSDQVRALDGRLSEMMGMLERLHRSDGTSLAPLTHGVQERIRPILEAAERAADEIRGEAVREAERIAAEARREAAQIREEAARSISNYLQHVEAETAEMLDEGRAVLRRREEEARPADDAGEAQPTVEATVAAWAEVGDRGEG